MRNERPNSGEIVPFPAAEQEVFDYFYEGKEEYESRKKYLLENDLVETNNLGLWIIRSEAEDPDNDRYWPWDYNKKPFGYIFEQSIDDYPELFKKARDIKRAEAVKSVEYWDAKRTGIGDVATLSTELNYLNKRSDRLMTDVFRVIAPRMDHDGFDILEVCK